MDERGKLISMANEGSKETKEWHGAGKLRTRREMLRLAAVMGAGGAVLPQFFGAKATMAWAGTGSWAGAWSEETRYALQQAAPADRTAAFRAQMAAIPIQPQKLAEGVTLLAGPGGNVVVLDGKDGKLLVDTFVAPAWAKLKETLDAMGSSPAKYVIDTHWHFDHADNNAPLHAAGATVIAHENTKKRLSQTVHIPVLELDFSPSPADALPQKTFADSSKVDANGEQVLLKHVPPAHTDTDIYVRFEKANVLHTGDLFFNGIYPFIDPSTGGNIAGVISAADKMLAVADKDTKIVPGHGPLGNKEALAKYRDMLATAQEHVQKLKSAGKSVEEAIAAKPLVGLDAAWGKGFLTSDQFVQVAYLAL